jgi:GNAT superfamily N-acetyltransferase
MTAPAPIQIKQASEEDVPIILTFIRELADYEKLVNSVSATEERLRATLFGPRAYAEAVIAYDAEEPVAFAVYFFNYSTFAALPGLYLEDIFVRPTFRGRSVGRRLFAFLADEAIQHGCARMEWSVLNWNQPAIRFYRKLEAEPVNDWTVFRLSRDKLEKLATENS